MNNVKQSRVNLSNRQALLRKGKMMLVLPVLIIPFITLSFWALDGGKKSAAVQTSTQHSTGLNLHLPDPTMKKESLLDKLGFYDKADRDSMKIKEAMRNDPYYQVKKRNEINESPGELEQIVQSSAGKFHRSYITEAGKLNAAPINIGTNQAEDRLMKKLAELNNAINQPQTKSEKAGDYTSTNNSEPGLRANAQRLQDLMKSMSQSGDTDPELDKLSGMMDKILDIQHPERIKEELKEKSPGQKTNAFVVSNNSLEDTIAKGFYSADTQNETTMSNAIEAVVNENQVLLNGSVIKLRLINDSYIGNMKIPAGIFVFGIVSLNGERLEIDINSVRYRQSLFPVKLQVYDMDGIPGINIPGSITRDVAKQSVDNSLQLLELSTMDPSLKAKATEAGIGAAKTLLSRKVKQVRVSVKAGYRVLIKDRSLQQ